MDIAEFTHLIGNITKLVDGHALDKQLESRLNQELRPDGRLYRQIFDACQQAITDGWMCQRQSADGVRYGRIIKPSADSDRFSVDVVEMTDVVGPHHAHPNGEIDLIMPIDTSAIFDGHGAGWLVYGPGTAHRPTVAGGRALILYLLPEGAIDFSAPVQ
jgi:Domain of unknown function (DUF4863)